MINFDIRCGGCKGIGRHRRWCRFVVGSKARLLGRASAELEGLGDRIGSNDPGLSNQLYRLSAEAREKADAAAEEWRELNEVTER